MNITEYQQNISVQYCFPDNNSCRKEVRAGPGNLFLFSFLSCISVCTVFLNLFVILSISHFKQLHTPTNLLILSLAVADLLMGLVVMPVNTMQLRDSCWYLGKLACTLFLVINCISSSASLCNMVFIAVDTYIAVNDPLLYSTKVTVCKMSLFIILGWSCSLLYVLIYLYFNDHLLLSQIMSRCHGECILIIKSSIMTIDLVISFLCPCSVIFTLYSIIFTLARRHAKAVRSVLNSTSNRHRDKVSKSSNSKAAKTLGIIVFVYLALWILFSLCSLSAENMTSLSLLWTVLTWLISINSSVNPLIYAIFYPWFRASAKYIVTCRLFNLSSSTFHSFSEHI
ncbi:trace amine-associated receptor 13c-like [Electrophorus electricus]|uniref:trace amine-associated receptor 13c-like n=1 Tax=Electrophorus electricus TaxID=8005 RepID=UPI0015D0083A|nr:trace amine-associated receptor 13c-like [Electrophorus electricus]